MNKKATLKLSGEEVKDCLSIGEAIEAVESSFVQLGEGGAQVPPKTYLFFDNYNGDYRSMPGYLEKIDVAGCKLVNSHPDNEDLPTVMALLVLVDPKNGFPFCLMDATHLTSYRTGAAGAVASKYLSREESEKIGFVGAGVQAHSQFLAINEVRDLKEAKIFDLSDKAAVDLKEFIERNNVKASVYDDLEDLVSSVDILVTTTPVREPIIKKEWVSNGTHINAIGADAEGKQELESDLLKDSKVVVDQLEPASHSGEISIPLNEEEMITEEKILELSDIVTGITEGRVDEDEITIFDSTGLAIQDVATGYKVYKNAKKKNLGEKLSFF